MESVVLSREAVKRLVGLAKGGADPVLDGVKVHLFVGDTQPTENTALADLVEPTFTGYAASAAVVWDTVMSEPGGVFSVEGPLHQFLCTADGGTDLVTGYFLAIPAVVGPPAVPAVYVGAVRLDSPVGVTLAGEGVRIAPRFQLP